MRRFIPTGGALALALLLSACGAKAPGGPDPNAPAPVGVIVVRTEPVNLTMELSGRTSASLVSEVRPQVNGVIKARLFQEGSNVRAGQALYQIDPATYRASLDSANAALAQAQATATSAKLKADRYKELVAINAVSKQDNDDAQAASQSAAANVQAQRAAVQQARINLDYTKVAAPVSGRIGKSSVTPGALVTANQVEPLATVQNLDTIYVDVTQSAADLLKLRAAMAKGAVGPPTSAQVRLILEDGSLYPIAGRLAFSDITVDAGTGSVGLRAVFPNPNGVLLPGLYVRARLDQGVATSGILVPQPGVSRDPKGGATVYVVGADGKAQLRPISVSRTVGDKWLVTAGLKAGERVIVEGLQKVRPGGAVKPAVIGATAR
ncbi:MAG: efflux RND transporter periplasmic adaptor subunit [Alphaproteobacteria bacterium]|nr:efflux RND transporter periplasmic adaptor subunit [Alphaproteobacteria bacterium]MBU1517157.1 efflux RND transporter periplasmic adaptor subunit [Alphaproteobacteria bacterium]MBU2096510.1 efflux RND transporter periplasmic adaptor subunit [Alphaproteobacteria bacterium]MBU2151662.1 efflux RND transporter periplasmic adaptor subunit [Alphaproteobacteria bacterium]MBU2305460.1 efflux RND transporter periplasmic adaptor subunit [Alphaproteobacteria bacterium]